MDLALSGRYNITKNLQGNIGYGLLEGGANGVNRYNFIQLHFIFASLTYSVNEHNKGYSKANEKHANDNNTSFVK